ncbi:uncharacterized protein [Chelonus insularis]|uniref:uncharacterized protein n=1 Tax=Chelonus insularis TaxID=460826 RepID=UPI00158EF72E|nr:uncharacterized protein LOC118069802 [Chelonus insularis]XP_034944020.1 uncharacterized protein LOC118069802 [Chelonus insularis]
MADSKDNKSDKNMLENSFFSHLNILEKFDSKQGLSEMGIKVPQVEKCSEAKDSNQSKINRPVLDSSLPYIPVYTHLITYNLAPIERPPTPPVIRMIRSELRSESPFRSTPESNKSSKRGKSP